MAQSDRHGLPYLSAGQAQKEITHNEALLLIDRLLQLGVVSRAQTAAPATARPGDVHIVAAGAIGDWAGRAGQLASYDGFAWAFTAPVRGCLAYVADEGEFAVFDGGWSSGGWPVSALRVGGRRVLGAAIVRPGAPAGGAVVDAECRAALTALTDALRDQGLVL